jgi:VWFA-related protein
VEGLSAQDFALHDEGHPREITSFLHGVGRRPLKLIFLIESSEAHTKAVNGLVDSLPKALTVLRMADLTGVASVFPGYKVVLEPTPNRETVRKALEQVRSDQKAYLQVKKDSKRSPGPTTNFDDLTRAVSEISMKETDPSGRNELVIVLVTDDFDLLDPKLSADASRQLLQDGTLVSAFVDVENVGIAIAKTNVHAMEILTPMRMGVRERGASYFAAQTGGPIIEVRDGNYPMALQKLLHQLSGSYFIGFTPSSSELDGKFHRTRVALNRSDLRRTTKVSCRRGFWATPDE